MLVSYKVLVFTGVTMEKIVDRITSVEGGVYTLPVMSTCQLRQQLSTS